MRARAISLTQNFASGLKKRRPVSGMRAVFRDYGTLLGDGTGKTYRPPLALLVPPQVCGLASLRFQGPTRGSAAR
jgi:hypothetical protein